MPQLEQQWNIPEMFHMQAGVFVALDELKLCFFCIIISKEV